MNFKDIVIYSDADNTFLKSWGGEVKPMPPENNLIAIKYFMDNGGHFSMATGREHTSIEQFFDFDLNLPIVQSNGCAIYDTVNKKVLSAKYLSNNTKKEIINLCLKNKNYYLCCGTVDQIFQVDFDDERDTTLKDIERNHVSIDFCMNNDLCKLCYVAFDGMEELHKIVSKFKCYKNINALQSSDIYFECFDKEADKGKTIKEALELVGLSNKTLVCIGDYYNDLKMLQIADIKVCPNNAPDDIKKICDFVVCDNNIGAIDDLIHKLEKM